MTKLIYILAVAVLMFLAENSWADERSELEELKHRVEELEKRIKDGETVDELGHKLHPIHSIYGLKMSGGLTMTAQGSDYKNNKGAVAISADCNSKMIMSYSGKVEMS